MDENAIPEDDFEDGYEGYDDDFCDHDDNDADIITGRAQCYRCGEVWWLTDEQLRHEIRLAAQVYECFAAEEEDATAIRSGVEDGRG